MTKQFLTFKQFYLRAFRCLQVFSRFVKFKNIVAILKNNSAIYYKQYDKKMIPTGDWNE